MWYADEALKLLGARECGLGYAFVRSSHPGKLLCVLEGDIVALQDMLEEFDELGTVVDERDIQEWLANADLEVVSLVPEPGEYHESYHARVRSDWFSGETGQDSDGGAQ